MNKVIAFHLVLIYLFTYIKGQDTYGTISSQLGFADRGGRSGEDSLQYSGKSTKRNEDLTDYEQTLEDYNLQENQNAFLQQLRQQIRINQRTRYNNFRQGLQIVNNVRNQGIRNYLTNGKNLLNLI